MESTQKNKIISKPGQPSANVQEIIEQANTLYFEYHPPTTYFERALFFSWWCSIKDCAFCFMSTQENAKRKEAQRHYRSILAEAIICKNFGWKVGFLSGGVGVLSKEHLLRLLRLLHEILGTKIWLNTGVLSKEMLQECKPYIEGIVGTIEVMNPNLHDTSCA